MRRGGFVRGAYLSIAGAVMMLAAAGKQIPATAACYSCHAEHGAVDNTFVQFYPTLLDVAKEKGTLR
jgi:cytochrome c553